MCHIQYHWEKSIRRSRSLALDSAHLNTTFETGLTQADRRFNCVLKYCSPLLPGMIGKNVNRSCYIFRTGLGFFIIII